MIKLKDNMLWGVVIGLTIPFASFFILDTLLPIVVGGNPLRESTMHVIALLVNFPVFRNVLINQHKDRLGRGMLLSTFALAFWLIAHHDLIQF